MKHDEETIKAAEEYAISYPHLDFFSLKQAFLAGSAHKQKWISVEDQLPEIDEYGNSDDVWVFGKIFIYGKYSHDGETIGWLNKSNWRNIIPESQRVEVSHWMPLPRMF